MLFLGAQQHQFLHSPAVPAVLSPAPARREFPAPGQPTAHRNKTHHPAGSVTTQTRTYHTSVSSKKTIFGYCTEKKPHGLRTLQQAEAAKTVGSPFTNMQQRPQFEEPPHFCQSIP